MNGTPHLGEAEGNTLATPWLALGIDRVQGRFRLTPAEAVVARCVVRGLSNKEVGRALGLARTTVRTHLTNVSRKLGVSSRGELAYLVFCESVAAASVSPDTAPPAGGASAPARSA